jgi:hypothetical protein
LAAGNAGGPDGYRGVEPEFRRRPQKAVVRASGLALREGRFAASSVRERDAPDAVVVPRHRVSPSASPMTGSSGVSSTPRLIGSITTPSGILHHPLSAQLRARRMMTTEYVFAISRRDAPGVLHFVVPSENREGAGKTGCALHPRSHVQDAQSKRTRAYRFSGNTPAFPAQWFYGL